MPRFVLLYHDCPSDFGKPSHWDLMLEDEGVLLTWALAEPPNADRANGSPIAAQRLSNHRLAYLDYEGPVSGNRGNVRRVDAGTYHWVEQATARAQIQLEGETLSGEAALTRVESNAWTFEWIRGED
jgi:hypothetical protein